LEYLVVLYPKTRPVKVDGQQLGSTNRILMLETGSHQVTLDGPPDFQPPELAVSVRNTSALTPMTVEFQPQ
jgi:PEGA domain